MKAAVITYPGSNCDEDLIFALRYSAFEVDSIWHKETRDLKGFDLVCLPGGFSYGDYLRCGAIAALSPIHTQVRHFVETGGFVLGLCNGFQILCEMRLLPGALVRNEGLTFICADMPLRVENTHSPWTNAFKPNDTIIFPIAHGDGRYILDESEYPQLLKNGQVLLKYVDNPNGSQYSIAGVCNEKRNVFGLMPHPERATDLRSKDGALLWQSIIHAIREKRA